MVNLTYGILSDDDAILTSKGTDLISTTDDGTISAFSPGDIAWVLTCTALVWIMIPGLGFLYSGLVRRKNALTMMLMCIASLAVTSFQWFFWGYSLAFSDTSSSWIGNLRNFALQGVLEQPAVPANSKIPTIVYFIYQQQFACLVPAIWIGAACERARLIPMLLFTFCHVTLVYCPLVAMIWNPNGWAYKLGVLDYAGGVPVEVISGTTGLVISMVLGKRRGYGTDRLAYAPHSVSHVVLGTALLWVGWLGFNGGSTFAANLKAALAIVNTNLAGSIAGLTWMLMDFRIARKWSVVGFCTGAIAGLVAITPAAGFVAAPYAVAIGFLAAVVSNLLTKLKVWIRVDDVADLFSVHAIAGIVGLICTGLFADARVTFNDAFLVIPGGWVDRNFIQLGYQLAWICVGLGWTFVVSYLLLVIINLIPGCHLRTSEVGEIVGTDEDQCGEFAYDFAAINRDLEGNYDLSGVKASKKDKFAGDSPASSATGVNMAEAGASEKENKQLDQRGAPIGSSVNGPMGAGPVHPSGDSTDAGHQAWERERNLMRHVPSSADRPTA